MDFNNLHFYQLVILIISGVMIYQGVNNFIQGKDNQTLLKVSVRLVVWGGMAFITLFPNFSNVLAGIIGIEGNINAVILTGFILVFLMIFKLLSAIEHLEQQITLITREKSLQSIQAKEKNEE
ncbi:MAG: hypothetical protein COZ29_00790 [Candidatus Moranbacteria bacterium CG_4_10_14_3_um_filter_45_9]|nr:MAG: hypothetical protein AUK19_00215 [Candidatus Moranbacteria bacterium CG2_30_45_14]PIX90294.1 MAG: hypothetical protein COZ29_00790 [Candidatus Moranbacteria bacterium CG_4_10_14_3_um_filter_45_9]